MDKYKISFGKIFSVTTSVARYSKESFCRDVTVSRHSGTEYDGSNADNRTYFKGKPVTQRYGQTGSLCPLRKKQCATALVGS